MSEWVKGSGDNVVKGGLRNGVRVQKVVAKLDRTVNCTISNCTSAKCYHKQRDHTKRKGKPVPREFPDTCLGKTPYVSGMVVCQLSRQPGKKVYDAKPFPAVIKKKRKLRGRGSISSFFVTRTNTAEGEL